jgi:hypothetical protein
MIIYAVKFASDSISRFEKTTPLMVRGSWLDIPMDGRLFTRAQLERSADYNVMYLEDIPRLCWTGLLNMVFKGLGWLDSQVCTT